jgi:hypothetical protein
MALASAVMGGLRPSQIVTWERDGTGIAEPLTGATLTGLIRDRSTGTTRAIAGALTVTDGAAGEFRWDYAAGDVVAAGEFDVQFNAAFGAGATPARTFITRWNVQGALT